MRLAMERVLYVLVWWLLLPLAVLKTLWRSHREPTYRENFCQRFGFDYRRSGSTPTIWLHAVSVGETRAAAPLIDLLARRYPQHRLLLTQMTATGRQTASALYGDRVTLAWLPWDIPGFQRRFVRRWKPDIALFMETEIWPALLVECARAGVPAMLINARLSARSASGYRRMGALTRATLANFAQVCAQTDDDAGRLRDLGAPTTAVTGNLKFDVTPSDELLARGRTWRTALGERSVVLLASTRDGEEALLLPPLLASLPGDVLIVVVPRHPQRFDEVAALINRLGAPMQRRSDGVTPPPTVRIWLGDSMGELFAWYALADLALIGGGWLPFGGQNLIEACAVCCPTVIGPYTYNFAQAAADAVAAGAAVRLDAGPGIGEQIRKLLADRETLRGCGDSARQFAMQHRGATMRTMEHIRNVLPPPSGQAVPSPDRG